MAGQRDGDRDRVVLYSETLLTTKIIHRQWLMKYEHLLHDINLRRSRSTCRKTSSLFTLSSTKAVRTGLRLKLDLHREKLAAARATEQPQNKLLSS